MDAGLKYISLLLLIPKILSGSIDKEELLDEMVKLGLTEEEKNELLKRVEDETIYKQDSNRQADWAGATKANILLHR